MKNQNWYEMSFGAGSWFQVSFIGFFFVFFRFQNLELVIQAPNNSHWEPELTKK